jgi:hypothetical protein
MGTNCFLYLGYEKTLSNYNLDDPANYWVIQQYRFSQTF